MSTHATDPVTVLVADDEPDIVTLIARRLAKTGYRVITAANGCEALERAQRELPAVAVLDVMMPLMTGIEVSRRLRSLPETRSMPVILISAGIQDKMMVPADADAFISKPFGRTEIALMVRSLLERPVDPRTIASPTCRSRGTSDEALNAVIDRRGPAAQS